jgi:23S rRNA pseudouridine2605 synthase
MHYKKRGVLVTHHDPQGREALFPHLQRMGLPHMVSVVRSISLAMTTITTRSKSSLMASIAVCCDQGRLDYTSEGLLLLTNNGRLAQYLEHPSNEYERKYKVRIRGKVRAL